MGEEFTAKQRCYLPYDGSFKDEQGNEFTVVGGKTFFKSKPFSGIINTINEIGTAKQMTRLVNGYPDLIVGSANDFDYTYEFIPPGKIFNKLVTFKH